MLFQVSILLDIQCNINGLLYYCVVLYYISLPDCRQFMYTTMSIILEKHNLLYLNLYVYLWINKFIMCEQIAIEWHIYQRQFCLS